MSPLSLSSLRRLARWLAPAWTLGILVGCVLPGDGIPHFKWTIGVDKIAHAGLFFGFGVLWMLAARPPAGRDAPTFRTRALAVTAAGTAYGAATEFVQYVLSVYDVVYRLADPLDFAADLVGLALAVGACYGAHRYVRRAPHAARTLQPSETSSPGRS
jgi:VanZ family protein